MNNNDQNQSNKNSITFNSPSMQVISSDNPSSATRAKSFKVRTSVRDYNQYVNTIKAYAQAGLPFEHIANAGEQIGDGVEKGELDAAVAQGWQGKAGEIAEDQGKIMAWQSRGERVPLNNQLSSASSGGSELITISNEISTVEPKSEKTIEVVEGINVVNQQPQSQVSQPNTDYQLENNPYLTALPNLGDPK